MLALCVLDSGNHLCLCHQFWPFLYAPYTPDIEQFREAAHVQESNYCLAFLTGVDPSSFANLNLPDEKHTIIRSAEIVIRPVTMGEGTSSPAILGLYD